MLLGRKVPAITGKVGGSSSLYNRSRLKSPRDGLIEMLKECRSGCGNHMMLLPEPIDLQLHLRIPFEETRERHVFLGMVNLIRVMPQVIDDVEHQVIVWLPARMKGGHLPLQNIKKSGEIDVFGMP